MGRVRKPKVTLNRVRARYQHGRHRPVRFIIHDTESNDARGVSDLSGIDAFWGRQGLGYGAHVVLDADGNAMQCAPSTSIVWATYMKNTGSLQFELVGHASWNMRTWARRQKQLRELAKWIAFYSKGHGIAITRDTVRMHRDYPAGGHTDPGKGFPIGYVIKLARFYRARGW